MAREIRVNGQRTPGRRPDNAFHSLLLAAEAKEQTTSLPASLCRMDYFSMQYYTNRVPLKVICVSLKLHV